MGGGGAERELAHLAGALVRRGTDVHVALAREGPNYERLEDSGAVIHPISLNGNHDPRLLLSIDRLIRRVRPDLVQTWLTQMDIAGGWISNLRGVPWILSERASAKFYAGTLKNRLRIRVARGAALVQANSIEGTKYWTSVVPGVRTTFIPSPVPVDEIRSVPPADRQSIGTCNGPLILFAGRFDEQKNVRVMIEAIAHVVRERQVCVALCGQGPQEEDLRRWVRELELENHVLLPGYVEDIWSWMKVASVFVSVSHFEGRPNTVVEAAAARCPLVVSDIPEHREFLEPGVHALVVDRSSPAAIAEAILTTVDDPDKARGRALAASRVVAEWAPDPIASSHLSMYEHVLRYHARASR